MLSDATVQVKYRRPKAFSLVRQWPPKDRPTKPPSNNWPRFFYKRHPELRVSKRGVLDWNRYDNYEKVMHWFEVIGKVMQDATVQQENVYIIDETGIMLSELNSVEVLVGKDCKRGYRGARAKRTTITAIECVSAVGLSRRDHVLSFCFRKASAAEYFLVDTSRIAPSTIAITMRAPSVMWILATICPALGLQCRSLYAA